MGKTLVGILMGSDSDFPVVEEAIKILKDFGVDFEVEVASAHRTPNKVSAFASSARERGIRVILAAAGGAAHLAGVVASKTTLPVLGIPVESGSLGGIDSLLSTVQMPVGIPVGTLAIGKVGARNAALFAISILALLDTELSRKLEEYRQNMERVVEKKSERIKAKINETFGG